MRIHKITRRNFMKVAGVSALAMGLAACGGSSSSTAASTSTAASASTAAGGEVTGDKVVINIGHINDESDSWHQGALKFKEYCEANSNGTIEVDVFPNSQLGPEVDMIQGILSDSGTVDITFTGESMQTYQPDLGMIGMPYLIQSDEQMEKVLTGEVGQEFEGLMEACGMKCLGYFTSTKKITSVADCNNLVIRTPQSAMTVAAFQALGAKPTPMALSEVFTSLQQGTIEAQENPLAMIETQSFYEVCPYLILTAHLRAWVYIAMGLAQYNRLSDSQKAVVDQAGAECQAYEHELFLDNEEKYYNQLQEQGMEFIEVDTDAFAKAMICVLVQVISRNFLPNAPSWTEELARYSFIYMVAFGVGLAALKHEFVNVEFLGDFLKSKNQKALDVLNLVIEVIILAMCLVILVMAEPKYCFPTFAMNSTATNHEVHLLLPVPHLHHPARQLPAGHRPHSGRLDREACCIKEVETQWLQFCLLFSSSRWPSACPWRSVWVSHPWPTCWVLISR